MEIAESLAGRGFRRNKKSPAELWLPDFYVGWVSKYNPDTILKRNSAAEKIFLQKSFRCGEIVNSVNGESAIVNDET